MNAADTAVTFNNSDEPAEFDHWEWVDYWMPAQQVVFFKRKVYRRALNEFAVLLESGKDA